MRSIGPTLLLAVASLASISPGAAAESYEDCFPVRVDDENNGIHLILVDICTYYQEDPGYVNQTTCIEMGETWFQDLGSYPVYVCLVEITNNGDQRTGICAGWSGVEANIHSVTPGIGECFWDDDPLVEQVASLARWLRGASVGPCSQPQHEICYRILDSHYGPPCTGVELRREPSNVTFLFCTTHRDDSWDNGYWEYTCHGLFASQPPRDETDWPILGICISESGGTTYDEYGEPESYTSTCVTNAGPRFNGLPPSLRPPSVDTCYGIKEQSETSWTCAVHDVNRLVYSEICTNESENNFHFEPVVCYGIETNAGGVGDCIATLGNGGGGGGGGTGPCVTVGSNQAGDC